MSLGQRMRADLAAAWLHNPEILFLDEPTIGLDVLVKEKIRSAIKMMNEKYNTTVILTTHDMQDMCRWISVGSDLFGNGHPEDVRKFSGISSEEENRYLAEGKSRLFEKIRKWDKSSFDITSLPTMPTPRSAASSLIASNA